MASTALTDEEIAQRLVFAVRDYRYDLETFDKEGYPADLHDSLYRRGLVVVSVGVARLATIQFWLIWVLIASWALPPIVGWVGGLFK